MIKAELHVVSTEDFRERATGLRRVGFALLSSLTVNEEDSGFVSAVHSPSPPLPFLSPQDPHSDMLLQPWSQWSNLGHGPEQFSVRIFSFSLRNPIVLNYMVKRKKKKACQAFGFCLYVLIGGGGG